LGDSKLEKMQDEAGCLLGEIYAGTSPRWLSYLGPSGTGKTYLAHQVCQLAVRHFGDYTCPNLGIYQKRNIHFVDWRVLADQLRYGEYSRTQDVCNAWFLVLDDIGSEYDPSGFLAGRIDRIINGRLGKWTIVTSNLDVKGIARELDTRIADRMLRDGNRILDVSDVKSFNLRKLDPPP